MAGNIKGITIEFRGDTTKLDKALREVRNSTKDIDRELRQVNNALKFNPTSVDLWRQKQELLTQKIAQTKDNLTQLKNAQTQMDASGVDKNSQEYRELQREIITTESKLKNFETQLRQVGNVNLKALEEQFKKVGEKLTTVGKDLTTHVTVPLAAIGAVSAKSFAEVDKTMQLTNSTMGNTEEQAQLLNQAMKEAAANSTYGMSDAATATLNFARAGLTAEQAAAALAPAMNLAAGEGGELDTVSAGLVATINGFHGSFDDAADYADVFANACNNSALDVNSLSEAMSIAAPIFSAAGYNVNDAALYMGVMANNGIDANKAATSLKTGLARLVSPAKQGAAMMEQLGISVTNADGTMKSSVQIQQELHDAFGQLSESEQIAAASAIFGKNQMAPWLALINTAPEDVNNLSQALETEGTTTAMADAMMSGFGGSLEKLKSSVDVAKTSLGEALAPAILAVANAIQAVVDWFNNLSPEMQSTIATIGVIVAAIGPLLVLIGKVSTGIGAVIKVVNTLGGSVGLLSSGSLLPIIGVIGAVIAVGVLLYKNWDKIKATAKKVGEAIKNTWNNVKESVTTAITNLKEKVTGAWDTIKTSTKNAWNSIKDAIVSPFKKAKEKIEDIIDKITGWFPIDIGDLFAGIKLPHFDIQWSSIGWGDVTIDYPSGFDINWYKTGGIFNSPSLIGVGEAGAEAVVPLDKFWDKLDNMQGGPITINVYPSAGMNETELARKVEQALARVQKQRNLANGTI